MLELVNLSSLCLKANSSPPTPSSPLPPSPVISYYSLPWRDFWKKWRMHMYQWKKHILDLIVSYSVCVVDCSGASTIQCSYMTHTHLAVHHHVIWANYTIVHILPDARLLQLRAILSIAAIKSRPSTTIKINPSRVPTKATTFARQK